MSTILDVFGIDWRILLIQTINFGIVLFVLYRFLYRPLMRVIEKRQSLMTEGVKNAERAKAELGAAEEKKRTLLQVATKDAEAAVLAAKKEASTQRASLLASAEVERERIMKEAEAAAIEAKARAIEESKEEVARMAVLAAEKILKEKTS